MKRWQRAIGQWLAWLLAAALVLQLFFVLRIALMAWWNPASTAFERSQLWHTWQPASTPHVWRQQWVDYERIAPALKQAVLTAEDDTFVQHNGVQWQAIEKAWQRNQQAQQQGKNVVRGGSTITQQLAKNLLLSGERSLLRKGQELLLTHALELLLDKRRILELYLNHAEWGRGVFGAEAAARHYFNKSASQLTRLEAARLAVMLPNPRHYERQPHSPYLQARTRTIAARMGNTQIP